MFPCSLRAPARQNRVEPSGKLSKDYLASPNKCSSQGDFWGARPDSFRMEASEQPTLRSSRVRRWLRHLFREWTIESWRPIAPAFAKPDPANWDDAQITLAWLGHATVLINFFGIKILTDPVLFPRIGIRLPGFTIGPKRLTAPALQFHELPGIDLILLSHAHFDHFDLRTLDRFNKETSVITAPNTADLLKGTRFSHITELGWGETKSVKTTAGKID